MSFRSKHAYYSNKMKDPIIFNPHTQDSHGNYEICLNSRNIFHESNFIGAAFIDPGTVSCGVRIVRFHLDYNEIEVMFFNIICFGRSISEVLIGVERELTPLAGLFQLCHYIVVESQPMIRCDVYRTAQHLISFLTNVIKNSGVKGVIVEVDPKLKTTWIGGPATAKQNGGVSIKEWSVKKAISILELRNDNFSLSKIYSSNKKPKEDLSDTVCYEYAWWSYLNSRGEIPKLR